MLAGMLRQVTWLQGLLRRRRLHQRVRAGACWMTNASVLEHGTSLPALEHPVLPVQLVGFGGMCD